MPSQVLKEYAKAVMQERPGDLLTFSAEYFRTLKERRAHDLPASATLEAHEDFNKLPKKVQSRIEQVFKAFDADSSGTIDTGEMFALLQEVRPGMLCSCSCVDGDCDCCAGIAL